jgi:pyridoxamine 5'-phosphate oxidase
MDDRPELASADPLRLFDRWFNEASTTELNDPNAAALATASADGEPTVRMVLVKMVGENRFCFFSNEESRKGSQLLQNPRAALCFHWKALRRQVRVEGGVVSLPVAEVAAYYHTRSRSSQISAAISEQSRTLSSRAELEEKVRLFASAHPGEIPLPKFWRGYCIEPLRIEFWIDGAHRLHDRFLFTRDGGAWSQTRLYP